MIFLVIIIIVILLAIYMFISIKVDKLKYRAEQHILKETPFNRANIDATMDGAIGGELIKKFLADFPHYTQESLFQLFQKCAENIRSKNRIEIMSEKVTQKMGNDKKIEILAQKQYKRMSMTAYGRGRLNVSIIYADARDEYNLSLFFKIQEKTLLLDEYVIQKGNMLGF